MSKCAGANQLVDLKPPPHHRPSLVAKSSGFQQPKGNPQLCAEMKSNGGWRISPTDQKEKTRPGTRSGTTVGGNPQAARARTRTCNMSVSLMRTGLPRRRDTNGNCSSATVPALPPIHAEPDCGACSERKAGPALYRCLDFRATTPYRQNQFKKYPISWLSRRGLTKITLTFAKGLNRPKTG
jgi:hypothetical protein